MVQLPFTSTYNLVYIYFKFCKQHFYESYVSRGVRDTSKYSLKSLVLYIFAGRNRGKVTASLFPLTAVKTERSEDSPQLSDDKRTNLDLVSCAHQTSRTSDRSHL